MSWLLLGVSAENQRWVLHAFRLNWLLDAGESPQEIAYDSTLPLFGRVEQLAVFEAFPAEFFSLNNGVDL